MPAVVVLGLLLAADQSAVAAAVMDGSPTALRAAIAAGADVNARDEEGIPPVMRAASTGRLDLLHLLLAARADARATTGDGASALMAAAFGGHAEAAGLLIEHEADANIKDQQGGGYRHGRQVAL